MNRIERDWENGVNSMRYRIFYTGLKSPRPDDGILQLKQFKGVINKLYRECKVTHGIPVPTTMNLYQWLDFVGASLVDTRYGKKITR